MPDQDPDLPPIEDIAAFARGERLEDGVRARIEADTEAMDLVRQIQTDDQFLTRLAGAWSDAPGGSGRGMPPAVDLVPGYRILGELHRGGQGTVYRAIQERTKRTVALKMMHGGANASSKNRIRFEREVELIASMRHPNIVTVFDGGELPDGGYFLAMEFIRGVPLVRADSFERGAGRQGRRESIRTKLRQFALICDAVQYAHLRGIIHRDIKPGNILVDRDGEPKVLDFGVAKVLGHSDTPDATMTGEFVGTFAYASPEQVSGAARDIDTRCDIYALGVVLYEMLTGTFPYDISGPVSQTIRNITEAEPLPASRIEAEVDGEVDAIIATAMAKAPDRRYQSTGALAADIRRYLAGEPVEARRDSSAYLLAKLAQRHRVPLLAGAALVVALAGVSIWMSLLYFRATDAERSAEAGRQAALIEADKATAVVDLFTNIIETLRPERGEAEAGREVTVREMLDTAAGRLETQAVSQSEVGAAIQLALGRTYSSLELVEEAERMALRARSLAESIADGSQMVGDSEDLLGWLALNGGRLEEAQKSMERALTIRERVRPRDPIRIAKSLMGLASIERRRESPDLERSLQLVDRALAELAGSPRDSWKDEVQLLNHKCLLVYRMGRVELAQQIATMALELCREHGSGLIESVTPLQNLAMTAKVLGDDERGMRQVEEAVAILRSVYPEGHSRTASMLRRLALILQDQDRHARAEQVLKEAIAIFRGNAGPRRQIDLPRCLLALGGSQVELGDYLGGRDSAAEAAALLRALPRPDPWQLGLARQIEGVALVELGDHALAIDALTGALDLMIEADAGESREALECMSRLSESYAAIGQDEAARTWQSRREVAAAKRARDGQDVDSQP